MMLLFMVRPILSIRDCWVLARINPIEHYMIIVWPSLIIAVPDFLIVGVKYFM